MGLILKPQVGRRINYAHPLAKGLVGCWIFNEGSGDKTYDLSGNGNDGTIVGADWIDGLFFVGASSDSVNVSDDNTLDFTMAFTLFVRFKTVAATSGYIIWKSWDTNENPNWSNLYRVRYGGSALDTIAIRSDKTVQSVSGSVACGDGDFHTGIAVYDGSQNYLRLYVDGVQDGSDTTTSGVLGTSSKPLNIGSNAGSPGGIDYFDGTINIVYIYNCALSTEKVASLHREPYAMFEQPELWEYYAAAAGAEFELLIGAGGMDGGYLGGSLNPMTG